MAENSKIEWTKHTFNPWIGCAKVAAGCTHCYAEAFAKSYDKAEWGTSGTRVKTSEANWKLPLKWNREAEKAGERHRVFCASLADVFEDFSYPPLNHHGEIITRGKGDDLREASLADLRRDLFALIDATPNLDWLLLTKRPENIRRMWPTECVRIASSDGLNPNDGYAPKRLANVWLGTSIATQADADKNIPELLKCRDLAPVLFVSAEPLLGPVNLCRCGKRMALPEGHGILCPLGVRGLDWVIVGGESGPGARPMHPDWVRSLRDQCQAAGVPFFFKQWGQFEPAEHSWSCQADGETILAELAALKSKRELKYWDRSGQLITSHPWVVYDPSTLWGVRDSAMVNVANKRSAGRLLDGREWSEFPTGAKAADVFFE